MISDQAWNDIWHGFLDVARAHRYYEKLHRRYQQRYIAQRAAILIAGTGAMATLADFFPPLIAAIAGLIVWIAMAAEFYLDISKRASILGVIRGQVSQLEDEYRALWESVSRAEISENQAIPAERNLRKHFFSICNALSIETDDQLNQQSADDAYTVEVQRYATS